MELGSQEARKGKIWNSGTQEWNVAGRSFSPRSQPPDWDCPAAARLSSREAHFAEPCKGSRTCLRNSVSTSLALLFISALAAHAQTALPQPEPTPELAPIAPPVPVFPYPMWMVASVAIAVLLVVAAISWAVVRHIQNRPQPLPPTPRELALAALEALRARMAELEPHPFSIEVSDVLRLFVTREFRVRATQQTSPEFLAAATASPRFSEADKALLAAFLEKADLIKFARVQAGASDSEQLLEQARRFVEGGRPA
ncbi:MAG: DUF4381 family protein [Verrucomicrobiota bacterium]